jgi:hypothetical protein
MLGSLANPSGRASHPVVSRPQDRDRLHAHRHGNLQRLAESLACEIRMTMSPRTGEWSMVISDTGAGLLQLR